MIRGLTVVALIAALTGCVRYTNSEGERCTVDLNPIDWAAAGLIEVATGSDGFDVLHVCKKPKEKKQ
jgi:hypothetical protein